MAESKIGSLTEEALKRKERLAALKRKNEDKADNNDGQTEGLPK